MATNNPSLAPSPPPVNLQAPRNFDLEHSYGSSPFMQHIPGSDNFALHLPASKMPRNPGLITPLLGSDAGAEDELSAQLGAYGSSSPGRRAMHYPSIHQGLDMAMGSDVNMGGAATPKSSMAFTSGISQSADPTPIRYNAFSSPDHMSPLHGIHLPGDEDYSPSWARSARKTQHDHDGDEEDDQATPMRPRINVRPSTKKRGLAGLGSSPMHTAKRSRYATMGPVPSPNLSSVPPSPCRTRTASASGSGTMGLMTSTPLDRSASFTLGVPPFPTQSRHVSNMSMVSSASTELLSPALTASFGAFASSAFPTSMSAPEMMGSLTSYSDGSSSLYPPGQATTVAPIDIMGPGPMPAQPLSSLPPSSVFASPDLMETDIPTLSHGMMAPQSNSPHVSSAGTSHIPTFPSHPLDRNMTLETIHEQGSDIVTPAEHQDPVFAPQMPYSVGPPSDPHFGPAAVQQYPTHGYAPAAYGTYSSHPSQGRNSGVVQWQQQTYPSHTQMQPNHTGTQFWQPNNGATAQQHAYPSHQQQHMGMQRAASASYAYSQTAVPGAAYHQSHQQLSYTHMGHGQASTYGQVHGHGHPSLARSASTSFIPSMPSMSEIPTGSTNGLFLLPQAPASAPMTSTPSLPLHADGATYMDETAWTGNNANYYTHVNHQAVGDHSIPPASPAQRPQMHSYDSMGSLQQSGLSSPTTPSKRKYPTVGKRLRPGPKPKNTPKKKRNGAAGNSSDYIPSSGIEEESGAEEALSSQFTSPEFGEALPPRPAYPKANKRPGSSSRQAPGLELGGPLGQPAPASLPMPMQPMDASHNIAGPSTGPGTSAPGGGRRGSGNGSGCAPQLVLDPAPRSQTPEGQASAGLPKDFIDKLFSSYMTTEGSTTGGMVKRFKCLIEGCERTFPRKSAISSHIQTHLDDKPFVCAELDCDSSFVRQHDLRRHMRIHTGNKPFPCACGKGFARGDALMRHRQRNICTGGVPPGHVAQMY